MSEEIIKEFNNQGILYYRNKQYRLAASNFRIVQTLADKESNSYFSIMSRYNLAMTYENIGNELENNAEYFEARKYYLLSKKYETICKNHLKGELLENINNLEKRLENKFQFTNI